MLEALVECRACPRLVAWRSTVAREKRAAFVDEDYWGRPVPGFGDPDAALVVVGLAPAAHGANRTGRMFTGDRSGEWLYGALHRAGLADRPHSEHRTDGLQLRGVYVTSAVHCAPPSNKPTVAERDECARWLRAELDALTRRRAYLCLGQFGYLALWRVLAEMDGVLPRPRPKFGHGARVALDDGRTIVTSYHPSQQNTFTGKLTAEMLDDAIASAKEAAGLA